jgi:hypothetical protein
MGNEAYPLKYLHFYKVKKDFTSDYGFKDCVHFKKGQQLQYQKSISNIHDMIEIVHFKDLTTGEIKIWNTRVENLFDNWKEYLEAIQK